jgi:glycosyltransferase involved in cell wall biosynthesis
MKILMVLDEEFPPDGRVEREIEVLMNAGHKVILLCYSRTGQKGPDEVGPIKVIRHPISKVQYKFKALAMLFPFYFNYWKRVLSHHLDNEKFDVIHFHDLNLAKVCIQMGKKKNIKVVGDYHENRPEIMKHYDHVNRFPGNILISPKKWNQFQVRYSKLLDRLILVTREAKEFYVEEYGIDRDKITVIENFPNLIKLNANVPIPEFSERFRDKTVILYLGDTGWRRGIKTIIEAAQTLKDDLKYHFVIIGTSSIQPEIEKMVNGLGLSNIELTGYMPIEKALSYFPVSKIGVCPFHRNIHHDTTYANKLFQYMAFGMPVVVSNCTSQVNVVNESECGLVFEAEDTIDFVAKIKQLEDPALYAKLSKNAMESVKSKYNFDVSKNKLVKLYEQLSNEVN